MDLEVNKDFPYMDYHLAYCALFGIEKEHSIMDMLEIFVICSHKISLFFASIQDNQAA